MADVPTTKNAILERFRSDVEALDSALAQLSPAELERPQSVGEWSLKDTLAHISSPWLAGQLDAYVAGRDPNALETFGHDQAPEPGDDLATNDGRNAWAHRFEQALTLEQVQGRYTDYVRRVTAALEQVPDEDFERTFTLEQMGYVGRLRPGESGQPAAPLWRWVAGNTWHHIEDHLPAFRKAE